MGTVQKLGKKGSLKCLTIKDAGSSRKQLSNLPLLNQGASTGPFVVFYAQQKLVATEKPYTDAAST